jgi:hypothetical protein
MVENENNYKNYKNYKKKDKDLLKKVEKSNEIK